MSRKAKILMAAAIASALLIAAAAVTISIIAVSRGKEDKGVAEAEDRSRQEQGNRAQGGQQATASSKEEKVGETSAAGKGSAEGQSGSTTATGYPDLVPQQIPASSVDEALLRQAATDYMINVLGGTESYQIKQIKISSIDPAWGKVTFFRQDQDLTLETLFYKQGGKWAPVQPGPGTPAMPTDL